MPKHHKTACRDWLPQTRSGCKFGDKCKYEHPLPSHYPCKFFAKGSCKHGDKCTYAHESGDASDSAATKPAESGPAAEVREKIKKLFEIIDVNGDDLISLDELKKVLLRLEGFDSAHIGRLFEVADLDQDGFIDLDEFLNWILGEDDDWNDDREALQGLPDSSAAADGSAGATMELVVQEVGGQKHTVTADPSWTFEYLKLHIADATGVPADHQDLGVRHRDTADSDIVGGLIAKVVGDIQLVDRRKLAAAGIEHESGSIGARARLHLQFGIDIIDLF